MSVPRRISEQLILVEVDPVKHHRIPAKGQPSWVATWGTRMALTCAKDEAAVRGRVRAVVHVAIDDDEIMVRRATVDDLKLVNEITSQSERTQLALGDWTLGIQGADDGQSDDG